MKKETSVTQNVTKNGKVSRNAKEMTVIEKISYMQELAKQANLKGELMRERAKHFLTMLDVNLIEYFFDDIINACHAAFNMEGGLKAEGGLSKIILNLKVMQVHGICYALSPVLGFDAMVKDFESKMSLDDIINDYENFLNA